MHTCSLHAYSTCPYTLLMCSVGYSNWVLPLIWFSLDHNLIPYGCNTTYSDGIFYIITFIILSNGGHCWWVSFRVMCQAFIFNLKLLLVLRPPLVFGFISELSSWVHQGGHAESKCGFCSLWLKKVSVLVLILPSSPESEVSTRAHSCIKQALLEMCHSPKVEKGVATKCLPSWTLMLIQ